MTVTVTPFLRAALLLDAAASGVSAVLFTFGASYLAAWMSLPEPLVFWSGVLLFPWTAALFAVARRQVVSRMVLIDIIAVNALWVAASFGLMLGGIIDPTALGIAFVATQAIAVAVLTELQFVGMRLAAA